MSTDYSGMTRRQFADALAAKCQMPDTTTDFLRTIWITVGRELAIRANNGDSEADGILRETLATAHADMKRQQG